MTHRFSDVIAILRARALAISNGDRGATATEYAFLVAFIAIAIVAGVTLYGSNLNDWFSSMAAEVP